MPRVKRLVFLAVQANTLTVLKMWRSLLSDMLQVKPARRATTADVRNRVRIMTSVAEEANGSIDQVASGHGITALW